MLCSAWDNLFQLCSCLNLQMGFDSQTLRGVTVRNLQLFKTKINKTFRAGLQTEPCAPMILYQEKIGFRYSFY